LVIRLLAGLLALGIGGAAGAALPAAAALRPAACPVVTGAGPVFCARSSAGDRTGWFWITAPAPAGAEQVRIRASRFQAVTVAFRFADGHVARRGVAAGAFGRHWRVGGAIAFPVPDRPAALTTIRIGVERPAWDRLLKVAITGATDPRATAASLLLIGAALSLLALSTIGNLLVGLVSRQAAPVWNAAWAACVLGWGLLWTQVALFLAPGLAGPLAARLATAFATAAIGCAGGFFLASAGHGFRAWVRIALGAIAGAVVLAGLAAAAAPDAWLPRLALLLNGAVLLAAAALTAACLFGWWRGIRPARGFLLSFLIPMAAVLWSVFADRGVHPGDPGGLYMVLGACALQTLWLTVSGAFHLWTVRVERDAARAAESRIARIAETDPLTGLLNRRGFVERAEALLADAEPVTLILLDLDRFKQVNDTHGHDVGDRVLRAAAAALSWVPDARALGRLGGEEFGLLAAGLTPEAAIQVANQARHAISAEEVATEGGYVAVTASAGISCVPPGTDFDTLYKAADRALYVAKESGRDRTELAATLVRVV
jgi:diguanylate cyclase (GGDEF)-like protein